MRLIWVSAHFPPFHVGGSAESVRLQAEALVRAGHECVVISPSWDGGRTRVERVNGVTVGWVSDVPGGQLDERVFLSRGFRDEVEGAIIGAGRRTAAQLIHAQDRRMIAPASAAARTLGVPAMVTLRDSGLLCPIATCLIQQATIPMDCSQIKLWRECGPWYREHYGIEQNRLRHGAGLAYRYRALGQDRALAERLACVAFVSDGLRRVYASAGWPPAGVRTAILPSPVDPAPPVADEVAAQLRRSHRLEGKPIVLFVGKPSLGKGWPLFVEVAKALSERAHFVQVGPMAGVTHIYRTETGERLRFTLHDGAIIHVGPQPHETALAWMRAAAVVMVPSVQADALPRVALEAQAQGTPVVGSDRGGIPEAVLVGSCVRPEVPRLTRAVEGELYVGTQRAATRAVAFKHFGPEATTARLLACYEDVLR